MTSAIGAYGSVNQSYLSSLFAQPNPSADSNSLSGVGGGTQPDTLFDQIDQRNGGSLSQSDMASPFQLMSSQMQSVLTSLQATSANSPGGSGSSDGTSGTDGTNGTEVGQGMKARHHGHRHHMQATAASGGQPQADPASLSGSDTTGNSAWSATAPGESSTGIDANSTGAANNYVSTTGGATNGLLDRLSQGIKGYEASMLGSSYNNPTAATLATSTASISA